VALVLVLAPENPALAAGEPAQKLLAPDGESGIRFGVSVAASVDHVAVGAEQDDDLGPQSGSAYVFVKGAPGFALEQKLLAGDGAEFDGFGHAVALMGDTVVVGAPHAGVIGAAYVFVRSGATWSLQQKLVALDGEADDGFGEAVALDGDTAVIGAPSAAANGTSSGSAYVFSRIGSTWTQQQKLLSADGSAHARFGSAVAVSSTRTLIGAETEGPESAGAAYAFSRSGSVWSEEQKLVPGDPETAMSFGHSVSLRASTALIGAALDDANGADSGSAYLFGRTGSAWTQQQKLVATDGAADDQFGTSVSLDQGRLIIGAFHDSDLGPASGSAYVFVQGGDLWTEQQKLLPLDPGNGFGESVALSGTTVAVGAGLDDDLSSVPGSAYVFTFSAVAVPALGSTLHVVLAGLLLLGVGLAAGPSAARALRVTSGA
jgi:hypothetical protein